jgi:hypothetical protein
MKKEQLLYDLSKKYGRTVQTIRDWKTAGAPLADEAALDVWLSSRRKSVIKQTKPKKSRIPVVLDDTAGAASALQRLERVELYAYNALQNAIAADDALKTRSARDSWLKISGELRKYDLLVEQARRSAGDLLPKSELLTIIRRMGYATRVAFQAAKTSIVPSLAASLDVQECDGIIEELTKQVWLSAMRDLLGNVPDWAKDVVIQEIKNGYESST